MRTQYCAIGAGMRYRVFGCFIYMKYVLTLFEQVTHDKHCDLFLVIKVIATYYISKSFLRGVWSSLYYHKSTKLFVCLFSSLIFFGISLMHMVMFVGVFYGLIFCSVVVFPAIWLKRWFMHTYTQIYTQICNT